MLPWSKVSNAIALASREQRILDGRPASMLEAHAEVLALDAAGLLAAMSQRHVARSLGWSPGRLRRFLAEHGEPVTDPDSVKRRTTTRQVDTASSDGGEPVANQSRTSNGPSRASPLKEEEGDRDSLSDKPDDVAEAWALLSEAWTSTAKGRRRIALNKSRRVALAKHLHGTPSVDQTPIEDILTAWTWMLTSDHWRAVKCRSQGSIAVNTLLRHEHGGKLHEYLALAQEQPATTEDFAGEAVRWWAQVQKLTEAGAIVRNAAELYAASGGEGEPPARTLAAWTALDTIGRCSEVARTSRYDLGALRKRFESVYVQARSGLHVVEGGR